MDVLANINNAMDNIQKSTMYGSIPLTAPREQEVYDPHPGSDISPPMVERNDFDL